MSSQKGKVPRENKIQNLKVQSPRRQNRREDVEIIKWIIARNINVIHQGSYSRHQLAYCDRLHCWFVILRALTHE